MGTLEKYSVLCLGEVIGWVWARSYREADSEVCRIGLMDSRPYAMFATVRI